MLAWNELLRLVEGLFAGSFSQNWTAEESEVESEVDVFKEAEEFL